MAAASSKLYQYILSPIERFIKDSRAVGVVLIACTLLSLLISNSSAANVYSAFWDMELNIGSSALHLPHTLLHTVNDALMAVFFLLVGMEIKRELLIGELNSLKKSLLPVIAAIGGMVVPATIFLLCCSGTPYTRGWGIPMATDIAFSLGILSLLGSRVPLSLRIFLTALAIIDDLGGILTIAVFYASTINWVYLCAAGGILLLLLLFNTLKLKHTYLFVLPGIVLWYCIYNSGVHATISGVLLAFALPLHKIEALEHKLHVPVNFIILPLFALANTAIMLPGDLMPILASPVSYGILAGLVLGKPIGICLFSLVAVKARVASLPEDMTKKSLIGMGMIAGIGFTMSIFMATLAFDDPAIQLTAKVAIIAASLIAGLLGYLYLRVQVKPS